MSEADAQGGTGERPGRSRPSLSSLIIAALFAGIASGLFFGESMAILEGVADGFIRLLQMAVLPYLVVSLVAGLGSLSYHQAGELARKGGLLLLILWGLCLAVVLLTPLAFPERLSASFFSTSLVQPPTEFDFIGLYIPQNPIRSMAENNVPAVVLFSLVLGVALMGVPGRQPLVHNLNILVKALARISTFVVYLTPIGGFAIAASTAGTMSLEEFDRLQVYVVTYVAGSLLLGLWILPGLLTALSPLRYRDVIRESRDAMMTAFTTGSLFVALPLLSESAKRLLRAHQASDESIVDVLVPVSFNFPHAGNLLSLIFILFAGWFSGEALAVSEYPALVFTGVASLFASTTAAMPFLLDLFRIPVDMVQLFFATGVVNQRFATLVAAMHVLVLTVLGAAAMSGGLRVSWLSIARYGLVSLALLALFLGGSRALLSATVAADYSKGHLLSARGLLQNPVRSRIVEAISIDAPPYRHAGSRLEQIRETGVLRVGFVADEVWIPFNFRNEAGDLVGFDIDMAHRLARDLGVEIEFVPFAGRDYGEHLRAGHFDICMTGFAIGTDASQRVTFSTPYMEVTISFLVLDHLRGKYARWDSLREAEELRIGIEGEDGYYADKMREILPDAEIVSAASVSAFVDGRTDLEAFVTAAEVAASLALLHPEFAVVVPQPDPFKAPVAYALPQDTPALANLVSDWIELKRLDGTIDALYRYWVLGRDEERKEPRWSVIRDVLHWID